MEKEVIKILKTNENIVGVAAGKETNVIMYEFKEKVIPMRMKREKKI